jgi:hypothetical protein
MSQANLIKGLLIVAGVAMPLISMAESNVQTGAGNLTATAHVDFQVTIPQVLYLRVGTGSTYTSGALAANTTIDEITFAPAAGSVGNGTAVAGVGGDLTGGVATAAVIGNGGNVTLNATSAGALSDGAGDSIAFTQITTAASTLTTATALPAPVLVNGASANVVLTAVNKVVDQDAKWTYAYANATTPPAGTYGGVNTNTSRVVYTATMP